MPCPQCQHEQREGLKFCTQCGTPLSGPCAACGFTNPPGAKFCGACGTALTAHVAVTRPVQTACGGAETAHRLYALLPEVIARLQTQRRVTYRTLTYLFGIDEALLHEIRKELTFRQIARDEQGEGLVWTGEPPHSVQSAVAIPSQSGVADTTSVPSPPEAAMPPPITGVQTLSNAPTPPPEPVRPDAPQAEPAVIPSACP